MATLLILIPLIFVGPLFYLGQKSKTPSFESLGIDGKELKLCGKNPNCVFSGSPKEDEVHAIDEIRVENGLQKIKDVLGLSPSFSLQLSSSDYLYYQHTSTVFGFVDDLEFKALGPDQIQVRSASRVGVSDLGANRRRVERIRSLLKADR